MRLRRRIRDPGPANVTAAETPLVSLGWETFGGGCDMLISFSTRCGPLGTSCVASAACCTFKVRSYVRTPPLAKGRGVLVVRIGCENNPTGSQYGSPQATKRDFKAEQCESYD